MCSQRSSSKIQTSSSVAANFPLQRNAWCGPFFGIESSDSSKIVFCKMVCWGALYQLCIPDLDETAETVAKCVAERWIQYFGAPLVIIADQGKEFVGTQFKEFTNANSTHFHINDVRARLAKWPDRTTR